MRVCGVGWPRSCLLSRHRLQNVITTSFTLFHLAELQIKGAEAVADGFLRQGAGWSSFQRGTSVLGKLEQPASCRTMSQVLKLRIATKAKSYFQDAFTTLPLIGSSTAVLLPVQTSISRTVMWRNVTSSLPSNSSTRTHSSARASLTKYLCCR